jgi:TolB protein
MRSVEGGGFMRYLRGALTAAAAAAVAVAATSGTAPPAKGAWPGTNGRIAFASGSGVNSDLYTMLPDGSHVRRLTHTHAAEFQPSFSAPGHRIVYVRGTEVAPSEIWVMNADGSHQRRVTRNNSDRGAGDVDPAFSRSGRTIVFASDRDVEGQTDLYTVHSDGTHLRRLTRTIARNESGPVFSPDTRRIVFSGETGPNSTHDEIYSMRIDGTHRRRLTHEGRVPGERSIFPFGADALSPDVSPNGDAIVFFRTDREENTAEIYRVDADGDEERRLTHNSTFDAAPVFSPDGRRIAFDSLRSGNGDIFTMGLDGRHVRRLTRSSAFDDEADWQAVPDD